MHKECNSNRHFSSICWTWANTPLNYTIYYDSAKYETLAGTAPQSVGCGARYSDIPMFSLGKRKLIIFLLFEGQRLAVNDHKQAETKNLNSINSNHLSANPSGIHLVDIYSVMYIHIYIHLYTFQKIQSKIRHPPNIKPYSFIPAFQYISLPNPWINWPSYLTFTLGTPPKKKRRSAKKTWLLFWDGNHVHQELPVSPWPWKRVGESRSMFVIDSWRYL